MTDRRGSPAHLVDFVEQEQRIADAGLRQVLQDLARHRADVSAAMAADLGFVTHAAERHAHELAVRRACAIDWPSEVLPTPGGPTRHRIGAFTLVDALLHGEVLEDALLDLLEAVMVLVEHLLGVRDRC